MGATFTPSGMNKIDSSKLVKSIDTLLKSAYKPQQKLFMLRNFLLPSFYHSYIFAKHFASHLKKLDDIIRKTVREKLHLPHDLPKVAFHAKMADGGMGIPSLRFLISLIANNRLIYKKPRENLVKIEGRLIHSTAQINRFYRRQLYPSVRV